MTTLGKYELHEQIGRGGFGTVYRAIDTTLNREVALKVLHPQLTTDPDFLERFRKEARLVAALDSPNIVTIHELGEVDGRIFIAMRYMAGGSLKDRLEKSGAIPFEETLEIFKQVCKGLSTAHKKGLVHRDIKPANILFDGEGNVVIGDFGLARAVQQSSASASSSVGGVGTPAYRAPELWEGSIPASPATDIYSLGCVFCEMLTGEVLFNGETTEKILAQHLLKGPQIPTRFPAGVPDGTRAVIEKTLAKDPKDRFLDMTAFANALQWTLSNKPQISGSEKKPQSIIEKEQSFSDSREDRIQDDKRSIHRTGKIPGWVWSVVAFGLITILLAVFAARVGGSTAYQVIRLEDGDSYDFLSGSRNKYSGGDFYFYFEKGKSGFWANNLHQRGIIDLGDLGNKTLDQIEPPGNGYYQFGVEAIVGHTYVSLAEESENGHYIIFEVKQLQPSQFVDIEFYYR